MSKSSLREKLREKFRFVLGKEVTFGPVHPDSYPVFITHSLVRAAMNIIVDRNTPWPIDPEYRIEMVMVKMPVKFCPEKIVNAMPPDRPGRYRYVGAIAKARFRRTPENPGGELINIAMANWNTMAVGFTLQPEEHVSVVPLTDRTHKNKGTE
ncbi:hypothetical protein F53441_3471 [Fusarium austroafricanum]|uniref:Uncharacterized protein n=1 Tax=Fusarium austroafricanum TaxID=2364996 RepID=A0A8H4P2S5_9HYPO|nr:hypothetical protein F53441_3471 [Fusarium austroafricanum]